jgi:hypothetical protein
VSCRLPLPIHRVNHMLNMSHLHRDDSLRTKGNIIKNKSLNSEKLSTKVEEEKNSIIN